MNECFQVVVNENEAINALLSGSQLKKVVTDDPYWVNQFNTISNFFDLSYKIDYSSPSYDRNDYIKECISKWNMPEKYQNMDIEHFIISKCKKSEEYDRVLFELKEYEKRNLYDLLRFLIYFVDRLRENDIIWGVGRGSSVSSFVLYLIGIHRINSLKYNLDIGEFLK